MQFLQNSISSLPEYKALSGNCNRRMLPTAVTGVSTIHKSHIIYSLCKEHSRRAFVVAGDESEAQKIFDDITHMGLSCAVYPTRDFNFRNNDGSSHEYEHKRLGVLTSFLNNNIDILICCIDSALQYTISPEELKSKIITIKIGDEMALSDLISNLLSLGYERAEQVEGPSQFSVRGGILDFFSPNLESPVRLEFWGDEIDSITNFDVQNQRRTDILNEVEIIPCREIIISSQKKLADKIENFSKNLKGKTANTAKEILSQEISSLRNNIALGSIDKFFPLIYDKPSSILDYINDDCFIFISEFTKVTERIRTSSWQMQEDIKEYLNDGILCKGLTTYSYEWVDMLKKFDDVPPIFLDNFAHSSYDVSLKSLISFTAQASSPWSGSVSVLVEDIAPLINNNWKCVVLAGTEKSAISLTDELNKLKINAVFVNSPTDLLEGKITVTTGNLSSGFQYPSIKLALITHGTIIERKRKHIHKAGKHLYNLSDLVPGDYVVHSIHGIGVFVGITKIELQGIVKDYIQIKYAKDDVLYVPVSQLDLVSKYIGSKEDTTVKLHKLGSSDWQKAKTRVKSVVKDIAKELIKLYAVRMQAKGFAFSEDTEWQRDFEGKFPYNETEDQLRCVDEIKYDMQRTAPMDRLLCGDVGFGKTEVALRAAFKCITEGKQCAFMVPTTILAWQHYQTVCKRFEGFPINVELLSRFRSAKQQEEIIKKIKKGDVDIVIGTHRLIQKDVVFKDLGLAIVDEEQRFGVAHKEKFKEKYPNIDSLTLSATPIPRTLNMALSGLRDMSVIEEPPNDRHPVQTYVFEYDKGIINDAIRKELRRGGQVYYLHNRVETIDLTAGRLQLAMPDARIGIAHGKMNEEQLSSVWQKMIENEIDILVCTTIIETGIDVPNANTLIIENADYMGLSQLHQIRGRVGRSTRRAYAYLTFSRGKVLTQVAQKRLSAIRDFAEFGSGIKLAMRDLELRGAGNVLGGEQHGHMEAVGYDMYLKLLNQAISEEKGEATSTLESECLVDLQIQAHIPEKYISNLNQRLEMYRHIADIRTQDDAEDVIDELIDRFGEPPESVKGLVDVALLRNIADSLDIYEIKQQTDNILFYQRSMDMKKISYLIEKKRGQVMLSASAKPYISVRIQKNADVVSLIKEVLLILKEA